jgi:hypothetical protein
VEKIGRQRERRKRKKAILLYHCWEREEKKEKYCGSHVV